MNNSGEPSKVFPKHPTPSILLHKKHLEIPLKAPRQVQGQIQVEIARWIPIHLPQR